ncbi:MAG: hypothetical protein ACT4O1_14260 [Gemmatimonadota bacterium]
MIKYQAIHSCLFARVRRARHAYRPLRNLLGVFSLAAALGACDADAISGGQYTDLPESSDDGVTVLQDESVPADTNRKE